MASIHQEVTIELSADRLWEAVRDVGAVHTRLAPGFVRNAVYEDGIRTVTFANGVTVAEPIVSLDDERRRLVWSAKSGLTTHYNASMQVWDEGQRTRLTWTADFLPDGAAPAIESAMRAGLRAIVARFANGSAIL